MQRPTPAEHVPYFEKYISLVPEGDLLAILDAQLTAVGSLAQAVPEERAGYRYAPGKWSIREVLGHLIDTERVFAYRALCIARGDSRPLNGFEQDDYAAQADADRASLRDLLLEFESLRRSNLAMLRRFRDADWLRLGTADGNTISVRALAYIMAGHVIYHLAILRDRYGVSPGAHGAP
ncbi:MAG: DinB family protein [Acidobacteriota bacterium]|nr:DinB family protein [Acidobacteriota bacterium]